MRTSLPILVLSLSLPLAACDFAREDDVAGATDSGSSDDSGADGRETGETGETDEAPAEDPEVMAEVAADAGDAVSGESALVATVAEGALEMSEAASSDEDLANAAADEAALVAICAYGGTVRASVSGNEVTYTFTLCSSHCGMHRATGDVVVAYSHVEGGVGVDITAENFRIDGTRSDLDLSAEYRRDGSLRSISVDTEAAIRGWFGNEITRSGQYDATFDATELCITHDGEWTTAFNEFGYTTSIENYRRCALSCPDQGSRVSLSAGDFDVSAEFVTDTTLSWEASTGHAGQLEFPGCASQ